ncbi:MAG: HEAT repeat domain-containing protein, partial [Myxococcota bacterium]
ALGRADRTNPLVVGRLAALLVDPDGAEFEIVVPGADQGRDPAQARLLAAPVFDGDAVVYWRPHPQTTDALRVTVGLDGMVRKIESGRTLVEDADPFALARERLADPNIDLQVSAVGILARTEPAAQAQALILGAAKTGGHWRVREAAVNAVTAADPSAVGVLSGLVAADPAPEVRRAAIRALARLGDPAGRTALEQAKASDPDPSVRGAAGNALPSLK